MNDCAVAKSARESTTAPTCGSAASRARTAAASAPDANVTIAAFTGSADREPRASFKAGSDMYANVPMGSSTNPATVS